MKEGTPYEANSIKNAKLVEMKNYLHQKCKIVGDKKLTSLFLTNQEIDFLWNRYFQRIAQTLHL